MGYIFGDARLPGRFWDKVDVLPNGCWMWTAHTRDGYGRFGVGSRRNGTMRVAGAHRVSYEALVGPVPIGLELDHLCRNRPCVNPGDLEPVTCLENVRRGMAVQRARERGAAMTECGRGHSFNEENTYIQPGSGRRGCRACRKASQQSRRTKRRLFA